MKTYITIAIMLLGLSAVAQEINIDLDNFTKAEITQGLKVNFVKSNVNKAIISGTNRKKVKIEEEKGMLHIAISVKHLWKEDNTKIVVYYKHLQEVEARQNSKVKIEDLLKQPIFIANSQEGSEIEAHLEVENLIAKAVTGGELILTGKADSQDIEVRAAGKFKGENLQGKKVTINIIGGGDANVYGIDYVKARAKAGGTIYIYGNPKTIDQETTFGGSIKKIN